MNYTEFLKKYFIDPEKFLLILYANGGLRLSGYGCLSGGYGGGIEINDFHALIWLNGCIEGMAIFNRQEAENIMKAFNQLLLKRFPEEVVKFYGA